MIILSRNGLGVTGNKSLPELPQVHNPVLGEISAFRGGARLPLGMLPYVPPRIMLSAAGPLKEVIAGPLQAALVSWWAGLPPTLYSAFALSPLTAEATDAACALLPLAYGALTALATSHVRLALDQPLARPHRGGGARSVPPSVRNEDCKYRAAYAALRSADALKGLYRRSRLPTPSSSDVHLRRVLRFHRLFGSQSPPCTLAVHLCPDAAYNTWREQVRIMSAALRR